MTADVELVEQDLSELRGGYLTEPDCRAPSGLLAPVTRGALLEPSRLARNLLVKAGERVVVVLVRAGLSVTFTGRAWGSAGRGEIGGGQPTRPRAAFPGQGNEATGRWWLNSSKGLRAAAVIAWLAAAAVTAAAAPTVRLKDIATLQGVRGNQLVGVGLVTGLAGRGDSSSSALLRNAVANLVSNFGFRIAPEEVRSRNCAVVSVSAEVPAFLRAGAADRREGGQPGGCPQPGGRDPAADSAEGANGRVYALAQGQVFTIGEGSGTRTVGSIPGGAIAEQEILSTFLGRLHALAGAEKPGFPDRQHGGRRRAPGIPGYPGAARGTPRWWSWKSPSSGEATRWASSPRWRRCRSPPTRPARS